MGEHLEDEASNLAQRYLKRADKDLFEQGSAGDTKVQAQEVDAESQLILQRMLLEKTSAEEKEDYDMARIIKLGVINILRLLKNNSKEMVGLFQKISMP